MLQCLGCKAVVPAGKLTMGEFTSENFVILTCTFLALFVVVLASQIGKNYSTLETKRKDDIVSEEEQTEPESKVTVPPEVTAFQKQYDESIKLTRRLYRGMTIDDVASRLSRPGEKLGGFGDNATYEWKLDGNVEVKATFSGEGLSSWEVNGEKQ